MKLAEGNMGHLGQWFFISFQWMDFNVNCPQLLFRLVNFELNYVMKLIGIHKTHTLKFECEGFARLVMERV